MMLDSLIVLEDLSVSLPGFVNHPWRGLPQWHLAHPAPQRHTPAPRTDRQLCQAARPRLGLCPPAADASHLTVGATQPLLKAPERAGSEPEPVPLLTPRPAPHSDPASRHVKPSGAQTNRGRLLRKVRAFWITGVLEHSLHGAALIALGLEEQPEAVAHPWQLVLHQPAGAPRSLPAGTRIAHVYDAAEGELLILGAPGSGKTTLLLELARELLARAEQDEQHPLPVVFNLSSWASKQQPLADWLVEELNRTYQVPHPQGQAWVEADQILPLLDGLDEVASKDRTACIEAINAYRQEHGLLPLVVCSRSADYLAQTARVRLGSAVAVQPLTEQQVDDYLASGGEPLWALRVALHQDDALRELTSTPLMLSLLTLTYQGMPVEELLRGASVTDRQRQIFAHYVERMFRHGGAAMHYTPEQTTHWLSWLAGQMKQQNQTVFYIEHLQPHWLSGERMRQAYDRWALRFPAILMGMLVSLLICTFLLFSRSSFPLIIVFGGLIGWRLCAANTIQQPHQSSGEARRGVWSRLVERLRAGVLIGLSAGLISGLSSGQDVVAFAVPLLPVKTVSGLSTGLIGGLGVGLGSILLQAVLEKSNMTASGMQAPPRSRKPKWPHLMKSAGIKNGILVGLLLGLSVGLALGLSSGLSGGLLSVLLIGKPVGVTLTDELVWSWRSLGRSLLAKKHMNTTLRVMVLVGLSYGLSFGLGIGLSVGLSVWLLLGLFEGVSSETIGDQHRVVPNQGIRRSARNSLVLGLISTGIVWLLSGLSIGLSSGLSYGLIIGLSAGLLAGLLNGGLACLRHYVLRFLLWRAGSIP